MILIGNLSSWLPSGESSSNQDNRSGEVPKQMSINEIG